MSKFSKNQHRPVFTWEAGYFKIFCRKEKSMLRQKMYLNSSLLGVIITNTKPCGDFFCVLNISFSPAVQ